jgi:phosphatidate cytidylyltransferase
MAFGEDEKIYRVAGTAFSVALCNCARTGDGTLTIIGVLLVFVTSFAASAVWLPDLSKTLVRTAKLMFVAIYPGLLAGYVIAVKQAEACSPHHAAKFLIMLFALVWINDSGAYFAGKSLGKRKFAPVVSPNKTWEGAIGGFLATAILGILIGAFSSTFTVRQGLVLGLVLGILAPIGDLLESAIKRGAGVKDSGTLLPGHGGVLDRIDSVLICAPVFYYFLGCFTFACN